MKIKSLKKLDRWNRVRKNERHKAEAFLREREKYCVSASGRFLGMKESRDHIWYMPGADGEISSLLIHSRQTLCPVFNKNSQIPAPRFLNRFLGKVYIHALQGIREDAGRLETLMEDQGYYAAERIEYELMSLDSTARLSIQRASPAGLVLRPPLPEDEDALFALQSAYEQEEVLPANAVFNPAVTRLNTQNILKREQVLVAELGGQVVGKINTSAKSFTRYQIGGVYVRPDCRNLGIGSKMTAVFAEALLAQGKGLSLFVKKRNAAACKVYRKIGFSVTSDYRITYY
jgi:ribosomal protein S18 acetylase RimI-like enzyme